jgi:AbiV family abortive infection protein
LKQLENIESDKEISAGLYTYVLEELGKMLLLKESELNGDKYVVRYAEEFVCHSKKFTTAFDYLSEKGHGQCIIINEGDFNAKDYNWHGFEVGLLANTKARLSIFYSDFEYSDEIIKKDETIIVEKIPNVDKTGLENAINELQNVISSFQSSMLL